MDKQTRNVQNLGKSERLSKNSALPLSLPNQNFLPLEREPVFPNPFRPYPGHFRIAT